MHNLKFVLSIVVLLTVGAFAQSTPTATLTASDGSFGASLGSSVAISGSTVAAGAPEALVSQQNQGAVYVFTKSALAPWTDMTESAKLIVPSGGGGLGSYVAMSGDGSTIVSTGTGGAYIFVRPTNGWHGTIAPVALLAPGPSPAPWVVPGSLGPVAINSTGDTIVAGAYNAGTQVHRAGGKLVAGVLQEGAAYVWAEPAGGWINANGSPETAKLTAPNGVAFDYFGWAVGISVNTIVVGAPADATGFSTGEGSAYLFTRPSTGIWHNSSKVQTKFTASDEKNLDGFGSSVAAGSSGALVAVGSGRGCAPVAGAAYVFARPSTWWTAAETQTAELTPSDSSGSCFGLAVTVASPQVIVGAPQALSGAGAAYTFAKPAAGWTDLSLPASMVGGSGSSVFGRSSSIGGRTTAVGSPGTPVNGNNGAGAVYLFSN